ncbi:MAG: hypothetical protein MJ076_04840 [Clostridia bacterium]|nr:hypothetical protein [Clostridia bacterium]
MDNTEWKITDHNIDSVTFAYKNELCIKNRKKELNILRIISPVIISFSFACILLSLIDSYKSTVLMSGYITPLHNTVCSLCNCSPKIGYLILAIIFLCIEILFSITLKKVAKRKTDISINKNDTLIEKANCLYNLAKNEKSGDGFGWIFFLMLLQACGMIYAGVLTIPYSEFEKEAGSIILIYAIAGFLLFYYYCLLSPDFDMSASYTNGEFCKKCQNYLIEKGKEEDARIKAEEKAKNLIKANEIFLVATSGEQIDYKKLEEAANLGHKEAATILAKKVYGEIDRTLKTERENLSIYKKVIDILENVDNKDGDALYLWLACQSPLNGFNLKGWNYFLKTMRCFKTEHSISQEYYDNLDYAISIAIEEINKLDNASTCNDDYDDIDDDEDYDDGYDVYYKDLQVYKDAYNEGIGNLSSGCSSRWSDGTCHHVSTSWYCSSCPYEGRESECYYSS